MKLRSSITLLLISTLNASSAVVHEDWEIHLGSVGAEQVLRLTICPDGSTLVGQSDGQLAIVTANGKLKEQLQHVVSPETRSLVCLDSGFAELQDRYVILNEWSAGSARNLISIPLSGSVLRGTSLGTNSLLAISGKGSTLHLLDGSKRKDEMVALSVEPGVPSILNDRSPVKRALLLTDSAIAIDEKKNTIAVVPNKSPKVHFLAYPDGHTLHAALIAQDWLPDEIGSDDLLDQGDSLWGAGFLSDGGFITQRIVHKGKNRPTTLSLLLRFSADHVLQETIDITSKQLGLFQGTGPNNTLYFTGHNAVTGKWVRRASLRF